MSRVICLLSWKTAGYMSLSPQIYPGTHIVTLVVIALSLTLAPVLFYPVWIFKMTQQTPQNIVIYGFYLKVKNMGRERQRMMACMHLESKRHSKAQAPCGPSHIQRMCSMCLKLPRSAQGISVSGQPSMNEPFNEGSYKSLYSHN